MTRGGRNGTRSTMLALLGDVHAALGDADLARETYLQARQDPGPYRQLFVAPPRPKDRVACHEDERR